MRILHLIPCLGLSGAEKQLTQLATSLHRQSVDCHVAFALEHPEDRVNRDCLTEAGVPLHQLTRSGAYDPRLLWSTRRLLRQLKPDLVQTWLAMMDVVGGLALRGLDIPWVVSERSTPDLVDPVMKMRLRERIVPWCSAVAANSPSGADSWRRRLARPIPCVVIPNAIDIPAIRAVEPGDPSVLGLPSDTPLILYLGRLLPLKNIGTLLEALQRVFSESDACALLIGMGPEQQRVEQFVRRHGLEARLRAPGFISDPWQWLNRADVFISLSSTEGMPNAAMEAVASGVPLVLSDIPPHRDLIDAGSAAFVPAGDAEAAAQATLHLLRDPQLAAQRADRALDLARRWSIEAAAASYLALYERLLGNPDRGPQLNPPPEVATEQGSSRP